MNERAISIKAVREAMIKMKSGKARGLDEFLVECLERWYGSARMVRLDY